MFFKFYINKKTLVLGGFKEKVSYLQKRTKLRKNETVVVSSHPMFRNICGFEKNSR